MKLNELFKIGLMVLVGAFLVSSLPDEEQETMHQGCANFDVVMFHDSWDLIAERNGMEAERLQEMNLVYHPSHPEYVKGAEPGDKVCVDQPVNVPRGTPVRVACSGLPETEVNRVAFDAYCKASVQASCPISPYLLAGIGYVESQHGTLQKAHVTSSGVTSTKIIGLPLNGRGPVALIKDTENGVFDTDTVYDRAVGPMQFIPTSWKEFAPDGADDPHNIYDASRAAAEHLCRAPGGLDLTVQDNWSKAILRYNRSNDYRVKVTDSAVFYMENDLL